MVAIPAEAYIVVGVPAAVVLLMFVQRSRRGDDLWQDSQGKLDKLLDKTDSSEGKK